MACGRAGAGARLSERLDCRKVSIVVVAGILPAGPLFHNSSHFEIDHVSLDFGYKLMLSVSLGCDFRALCCLPMCIGGGAMPVIAQSVGLLGVFRWTSCGGGGRLGSFGPGCASLC